MVIVNTVHGLVNSLFYGSIPCSAGIIMQAKAEAVLFCSMLLYASGVCRISIIVLAWPHYKRAVHVCTVHFNHCLPKKKTNYLPTSVLFLWTRVPWPGLGLRLNCGYTSSYQRNRSSKSIFRMVTLYCYATACHVMRDTRNLYFSICRV